MSPYPVPCIVPATKLTATELPTSILDYNASLTSTSGHLSSSANGKNGDAQADEVLDGGWVQDINGMLNFNKAFVTKGMMKHVTDD